MSRLDDILAARAEETAALRSAASTYDSQKLQRLVVQELTGDGAIKVTLRGGCMPERGLGFGASQRGGTYTPLFANAGFSTATGTVYDPGEMTFSWQVPFFLKDDFGVEGTDAPTTPEQLFEVFEKIRSRARSCLVQLGPFSRIGLLRQAKATPEGGYLINPVSGNIEHPGINLAVELHWDWTSDGIPDTGAAPNISIPDIRGQLASSLSRLSSELSDSDPFAPDFLTSLKDGLNKLTAGISSLRNSLNKLGAFASAPARLANQALSTARLAAGLANDLDRTLGDIALEYQAVDTSAASMFGARRSKGAAKQAMTDVMTAILAAITALERRRKRVVGVHPGELLTTVSARVLGSADRWHELADLNAIDGQKIPVGVFSIEVKG